MRPRPILRLEEKIDGERALLEALDAVPERGYALAAAVAAAAVLGLLAFVPRPSGRTVPPAVVTASGSWTTVLRDMPPPPAPAGPGPVPESVRRSVVPPEPISLDAFGEPEPIPEPTATPFLPALTTREPEAPMGTPEPPPEGPVAAELEEPEVETVPPRIAPGGQVQPGYPVAARSLRLSGYVRLEVQVDPAGGVTGVRVLGTDRPGVGFEDAAVRAVERWRFVPATRGSVPVAGTTVVRVDFRW